MMKGFFGDYHSLPPALHQLVHFLVCRPSLLTAGSSCLALHGWKERIKMWDICVRDQPFKTPVNVFKEVHGLSLSECHKDPTLCHGKSI